MLHMAFDHIATQSQRSVDTIIKDVKSSSQEENPESGAAVIVAAVQAGAATYKEILTGLAYRSDMVTAGKSIEQMQAEFSDPANRMHLAPPQERAAISQAYKTLYPNAPETHHSQSFEVVETEDKALVIA